MGNHLDFHGLSEFWQGLKTKFLNINGGGKMTGNIDICNNIDDNYPYGINITEQMIDLYTKDEADGTSSMRIQETMNGGCTIQRINNVGSNDILNFIGFQELQKDGTDISLGSASNPYVINEGDDLNSCTRGGWYKFSGDATTLSNRCQDVDEDFIMFDAPSAYQFMIPTWDNMPTLDIYYRMISWGTDWQSIRFN